MEEERGSFKPRRREWYETCAMQPRGLIATSAGSGPYAAPAVSTSQGIQRRPNRYTSCLNNLGLIGISAGYRLAHLVHISLIFHLHNHDRDQCPTKVIE